MLLSSPCLDDRDFWQLMEEAKNWLARECPEWTDLSPGDPGTALLEVFAHLTEVMIYRLNRLPDKVFVELLHLMGVSLSPPVAASTVLRFSRVQDSENVIEIPRGTQVMAKGGGDGQEPVVFVTSGAAILDQGCDTVDVAALHGELVEAELVGRSTGLPGQRFQVRRPPIVASSGPDRDPVVAVEAPHESADELARAIRFENKVFEVWRKAENFADMGTDRKVYCLDRASGELQFAPAARSIDGDGILEESPQALAEIPRSESEIRVWYWRGGGESGNLAVGTLRELRSPILGVEVTNPHTATGGRAAETLQNALIRGPQSLHGLERVVTSTDFERLAIRSSGTVARARALTMTDLWRHAVPGTVQVILIPNLPKAIQEQGRISASLMARHETEEARLQILSCLEERRPLGTTCWVSWGRFKTVSVGARIVVYREESPAALRARVVDRLHRTIQPLNSELLPNGWRFGETLRASHVYEIVLSEPGVKYADNLRLRVDDRPDGVRAVVADCFQPQTWYVSSAQHLFRSSNDGAGWELVGRFEDETIRDICSNPETPGLLAVATRPRNGEAKLYMSEDCGESWRPVVETDFEIEGMSWLPGRAHPTLLLASDAGLYQVSLRQEPPEMASITLDVDGERMGFYSVATFIDVHGHVLVAVAAQRMGGVFLSRQGGRPFTFLKLGLEGEDIRSLAIQQQGPKAWLWAGVAAAGNQVGKGCFRWYLTEFDPAGWYSFAEGWTAGSCHDLAFHGTRVLAASHRAGVLRLDSTETNPSWVPSAVATSGLPPRDRGRLMPIYTVGVDPDERWVLAGGLVGVFRSGDEGEAYEALSEKELDKVTLPETWLFCSGEHEIDVVTEDEAERY